MSQWVEIRHLSLVEGVAKKRMARRWQWDIKTVRRALEQPRTARPTGGPRRATPPPQPHIREPAPESRPHRHGGRQWPEPLAAHDRLRDAAYHWARVAAQRDPASRAKCQALRSRGHGHARSLRSVADRLLNIACAMLRIDVAVGQAGTVEEVALPGPHSVAVMTAR